MGRHLRPGGVGAAAGARRLCVCVCVRARVCVCVCVYHLRHPRLGGVGVAGGARRPARALLRRVRIAPRHNTQHNIYIYRSLRIYTYTTLFSSLLPSSRISPLSTTSDRDYSEWRRETRRERERGKAILSERERERERLRERERKGGGEEIESGLYGGAGGEGVEDADGVICVYI
jgi:hypothetical protein